MSIFDSLIGIMAPHNCLGCAAEGSLLCARCFGSLPGPEPRCYRCLQSSPGWLTCVDCQPASGVHSARVAAHYVSPAKDLIWKLKLDGARAAADLMARQLAGLIDYPQPRTLVVPVPTATSRRRQRGYDQAKLIGRAMAHRTGLLYTDCLLRTGQTHQHGLSRQERLRQLAAAFRLTGRQDMAGASVILVDDVITTGATIEAAAEVLKQAGALRISAVACAQPDKKQ